MFLSLFVASTVQYLEHNLLLLVTSASDLPLRTIKFCSVLFVVVVYAGCDKQDSLMRGGKLHGRPLQLLLALQQSSIDQESRFVPTPPAFDPPPLRGSPSKYCQRGMTVPSYVRVIA